MSFALAAKDRRGYMQSHSREATIAQSQSLSLFYKYENFCLPVCLYIFFLSDSDTELNTLWYKAALCSREGSNVKIFRKAEKTTWNRGSKVYFLFFSNILFKLTENLKEKWTRGNNSAKNQFFEKLRNGFLNRYIRNAIYQL